MGDSPRDCCEKIISSGAKLLSRGLVTVLDNQISSGRRAILGLAASSGSAALVAMLPANAGGALQGSGVGVNLNVQTDFGAIGDGVIDDTVALQSAIDAGARQFRPVFLPVGVYRTTRPLIIPSNAMLIGSALAAGFGCRLEPNGCPVAIIGGSTPSFHCLVENLLIWPKGAAPDFILSIDNSYSVTLRNIRIHNAQQALGRAALLLLGDPAVGGHGRCNDILWENVIVRSDEWQPLTAVLASRGCGSHRFMAPCLENYQTLLEWQGGQLDLVAPYTERAGRYAVNCNTDPLDTTAYLTTVGGSVSSAESGVACAIRSNSGTFNSFGTIWGAEASHAAYAYSLPERLVVFHGLMPNLSGRGRAQFGGVSGWQRSVRFPDCSIQGSVPLSAEVPGRSQHTITLAMPGVQTGSFWVRVIFEGERQGLLLDGYVSAVDAVTIVACNVTDQQATLRGTALLECGHI
jgi:hypothetical protein